jgi:phosphoglycolate phosphatase-like HAD superfamily hydrolase
MIGPVVGHVVFDFDGTLIRSNQIKRDCFYAVVAGVPGAATILGDLFASGYRGDRFALFREVARRLGRDGMIGVPEPDELAAGYGRLCRERIAAAPEVPGAEAALTRLAAAGARLYLISATPQQALEEVVADRGLTRFFDLVLGAPTGKPTHLRRVIEARGIDAAEIVIVGDGRDDQSAALDIGCRFVAVTDQPNARLENVGTSIPDLRDLPRILGLPRSVEAAPAEGSKR